MTFCARKQSRGFFLIAIVVCMQGLLDIICMHLLFYSRQAAASEHSADSAENKKYQ